ncbi:RES family NAD+ phosphorylase [Tomitella gaofuii]|uniref:RES family NAD+ phosphorylase n=1 Tax=Tomitella gaofuii TaxID=2760083 RepID=UPI0015FB9DE6|nr:RES family NAD+ phosphorylase [Tomitella gaofuii]
MSRDQPALPSPSGQDLADFPPAAVSADTPLWRGHRRDRGPWWFSSAGGRFDLPTPHGTCYLGYDEQTAVRETIGNTLAAGQIITAEFAAGRVVSALQLPSPITAADTCHHDAVQYGLTRELCTTTPYDIPQQWAAAFFEAGHGGIQYQTRFTTGTEPNAVAVFGEAGEADWAPDLSPAPFAAAARRVGITVAAPPRSVRITSPPGV